MFTENFLLVIQSVEMSHPTYEYVLVINHNLCSNYNVNVTYQTFGSNILVRIEKMCMLLYSVFFVNICYCSSCNQQGVTQPVTFGQLLNQKEALQLFTKCNLNSICLILTL